MLLSLLFILSLRYQSGSDRDEAKAEPLKKVNITRLGFEYLIVGQNSTGRYQLDKTWTLNAESLRVKIEVQ